MFLKYLLFLANRKDEKGERGISHRLSSMMEKFEFSFNFKNFYALALQSLYFAVVAAIDVGITYDIPCLPVLNILL